MPVSKKNVKAKRGKVAGKTETTPEDLKELGSKPEIESLPEEGDKPAKKSNLDETYVVAPTVNGGSVK